MVTSGNDISKEIGQRITSGWRRFGEYSHFLKDRNIPICLKRTIMDTVYLTGSDLWGRDMGSKKISGEEACSGPTKHGETVIKYHKETRFAMK